MYLPLVDKCRGEMNTKVFKMISTFLYKFLESYSYMFLIVANVSSSNVSPFLNASYFASFIPLIFSSAKRHRSLKFKKVFEKGMVFI